MALRFFRARVRSSDRRSAVSVAVNLETQPGRHEIVSHSQDTDK